MDMEIGEMGALTLLERIGQLEAEVKRLKTEKEKMTITTMKYSAIGPFELIGMDDRALAIIKFLGSEIVQLKAEVVNLKKSEREEQDG